MANALFGRTLLGGLGDFAGNAVLITPVTVALSVIWGLYGLASRAYRVTVFCVIHLAYMRRRQQFAHMCQACDEWRRPEPVSVMGVALR